MRDDTGIIKAGMAIVISSDYSFFDEDEWEKEFREKIKK